MTREGGEWRTETVEDPQSNVFHKAMMLTPSGQGPSVLTLGGTGAFVKLWRRSGKGSLEPTTLWKAKFGGKFNRMRDAEVADLYGDGKPDIAVATHDQGIVAILRQAGNEWKVERIDEKADTFVHEIEIGDLDKDGALEVYATPSEPNKLDAEAQHGEVVRYVPKDGKGPTVVADLGKPVLLAHSPDDDLIPASHGAALRETAEAGAAARVDFVELDGGHNDGHLTERRHVEAVAGFLR